jgi:hypothetical protein
MCILRPDGTNTPLMSAVAVVVVLTVEVVETFGTRKLPYSRVFH